MITCFGTNALNFSSKFNGLRSQIIALGFWNKVPVFREWLNASLVPSTKKSIIKYFQKSPCGQVGCLAVGGAAEALLARPAQPEIILKPRLGFIKIAITTGVDLVPVFAFGENEIWDQGEQPKPGSVKEKFFKMLNKVLGITMPDFHGRGVFNYNKGKLPFRRPIHVVVGKAIRVEKNEHPTEKDIKDLHEVYTNELQKLYEEYAPLYTMRLRGVVPKLIIN